MDELENDNAIYEEIDSAENCDITLEKNEAYAQVKKLKKDRYNHFGEKLSNRKTMVVIILTIAILVLLLGAVAASSGYALLEISQLKAEMTSSNRAAFQQQNADFTSKLNSATQLMNDSVELLQQQLRKEFSLRIQHLSDRITSIQTAIIQQNSTLDSRIDQVQEFSQNATQENAASISVLQQQSAQNDSTLDVRIASIKTQLNCGGTPGWRRVGYLDMTDSSQSCPTGLALKTYSPGLRSCGRDSNSRGCWSTFYNTGGSQFSRVCGRVRGYQFGATSAFYYESQGINSFYVEGVSLTHGQSNRSHIWTFVSGLSESISAGFQRSKCPCTTSYATQPPAFVGNDYFCESGFHGAWIPSTHLRLFFPNDPLWDSQNCLGSCCELNSPPYFIKNLPIPTTDNIELRICADDNGDTPIDQLELYVQ